MTNPKRAWIVIGENCGRLLIDGYRSRPFGVAFERGNRHIALLLSMFPGIEVRMESLYHLQFITESGQQTGIFNLDYDEMHDTLKDFAGRGLDLQLVEGLREIFPEGV